MFFKPKPHVSDALRHLRVTIVACGLILGVCIALQTLVWGFVHFTDARWQEVEEVVTDSHVTVVPSAPQPGSLSGRSLNAASKPVTTKTVRINRVLSRTDGWFASIVGLTSTLGVITAIILAIAMHQGVVIAGGACVPGVERAVTAGMWAVVVALICAPIGVIIPEFPFSGVFTPYAAMTQASDAIREGLPNAPSSTGFYAEHLLLPLIAFAGVIFVVVHFLAGVEQGVIATSVSELDEKLAREMASIKRVAANQPRSIGALNQAMGERGEPDDDAPAAKPKADPKSLNSPNPGAPLSRPI